MQTPYEILGLEADANDDEIKQAYLQQVKNNPPDRNQEKFQLIHDAYRSIEDHKSRLKYDLFTIPVANFNTVIDQALHTEQPVALNFQSFKQILTVSIDDANLLSAIAEPEKS
ncbi:MAG: molecular chaperone DnaJ [Gammaproteobacteria bacterium]|nr:MAG: molecular chaperone DnaJ [Gammaproteobacteria bacterium]